MNTSTSPFEKRATAYPGGTYYRSALPRTTVRQHLNSLSLRMWKSAALGGDQEQAFEQAFSSLAYSHLKDKAPRLLDFLVGFQLVDRNEDNTKAMGVFGAKVGDMWLYAPAFFLNGDLKGHELLYVKNQDAIVPLKENWVNYLISLRPHILGEGSEKNTFQLGGLMPNLSRLSRTPTGTKYGADTPLPVPIAEWSRPALPLLASLMRGSARFVYPAAAVGTKLALDKVAAAPLAAALAPVVGEAFDLRQFLKPFPLLKMAFEKCYMAYPLVKRGFDRFYGVNFFREMAEEVRAEANCLVKGAASYIEPPDGSKYRDAWRKSSLRKVRPKRRAIPYLVDEEKPAPPEKGAGLEIYALDVDTDVPVTVNRPELDEDERERLLRDRVLIKDKRDPHATSIAYNTQVKMELVNPSDTGLYEVLEKPGSFDQMLVIMNPHTGRGRENFSLVVRKSAPRNWMNTHRNNLWTKSCDCPVRADFATYVDGLDGVTSLEKGGTYIAVLPSGTGTCPFEVRDDYGDGNYKVAWKDSVSGWTDRPQYLPKINRPHDWEVGYNAWDAKVSINQRDGCSLRSVNGELSIPKEAKIVRVSDPPKPKKPDDKDCLVSSCCCSGVAGGAEEGSETSPVRPGNLVDVQLFLQKTAAAIALHDLGASGVRLVSRLGDQMLSKTAALVRLVVDHGLREKQAREMLREAARLQRANLAAKFFVKYAYGYGSTDLLSDAPTAPAFPPPMTGVETMGRNAVQSIYPQEEFLPIDSMSSQRTDPSIYDPFYTPDQGVMQIAQQSAAAGQKEVFDTSMVAGMLRSIGGNHVRKYNGKLMEALNALGRILMLFFWNPEEFEDQYGKQDMPELEDSLRNAFDTLGDVCLYLAQKQVGGGFGTSGISAFGQSGTPDVEAASRA